MSRSHRPTGGRRLSLLIAVLALTGVGTAWAATAPRSGSYRAKGAVKFAFKLTPGTCPLAPKNLHNPNARRGKEGHGLCFRTTANLPVNPACGADGHPISGLTADLSSFDGLRMASGTLHLKSYTYESSTKPFGSDELDLTIHGGKGSGFIDVKWTDGLGLPCDTGKLKFTVAHT